MAQPHNFWIVMHYFVRRLAHGASRTRGYWTDGTDLRLNGHTLALWRDGAVSMFLTDARWHPYMLAMAIPKVAEYCADHGVLAAPDRAHRVCREHSDCRKVVELGRDCAASRPPSRPLTRSFHEEQHDLPLPSCPHKRPHSRWEACLAARNAAAARRISLVDEVTS